MTGKHFSHSANVDRKTTENPFVMLEDHNNTDAGSISPFSPRYGRCSRQDAGVSECSPTTRVVIVPTYSDPDDYDLTGQQQQEDCSSGSFFFPKSPDESSMMPRTDRGCVSLVYSPNTSYNRGYDVTRRRILCIESRKDDANLEDMRHSDVRIKPRVSSFRSFSFYETTGHLRVPDSYDKCRQCFIRKGNRDDLIDITYSTCRMNPLDTVSTEDFGAPFLEKLYMPEL